MACAGCTVGSGSTPQGCGSKGNCGGSGCNRLNTFDWLTALELDDAQPCEYVEVSFKNGAQKSFFRNDGFYQATTGDLVAVEAKSGYDIGTVSLSGELVRLQLKRKKVKTNHIQHSVLRPANERDMERLDHARSLEKQTMVRARAIARMLDLKMKIGDVQFQGDGRKATFFYTADGRIDFRELIRHFAKEFKVKIEMRQIGARQESARIGGIGSCGRELCCSTWLTDFKSVTTSAARYQNLAINQAKLSGQCGRLKCCLNYELDTYVEVMERFPKKANKLKTSGGVAILVKTDIFRQTMYYAYEATGMRGRTYALDVDRVNEILAMNRRGEFPDELMTDAMRQAAAEAIAAKQDEIDLDFADVTGEIELPPEKRRKKRRNRNRNRNKTRSRGQDGGGNSNNNDSAQNKSNKSNQAKKSDHSSKPKHEAKGQGEGKDKDSKSPSSANNRRRKNRNRNRNRNRNKGENIRIRRASEW